MADENWPFEDQSEAETEDAAPKPNNGRLRPEDIWPSDPSGAPVPGESESAESNLAAFFGPSEPDVVEEGPQQVETKTETEGETEGEDEDEESETASEELGLLVDHDDGIKRRWYALHAYSGQEGNVKRNLLVQAQQAGLDTLLAGVLVPMEEVAEMKAGEKRISKRKFFPGYVLVRLPEHPERNPDLWHLIKNTPGVSGFIGGSRTVPTPLEDAEVQAIIEEIRGERERPKPKVKFEEGERVKIIDGPFVNFLGNIGAIDLERGRLKVSVEIFERSTPVEVEFWQVEKI